MKVLPLTDEQLPLVIQELLFTLKIRDAMTRNPICARRDQRLREVQELMRERGITGVPVVEKDRLFGILSMDDILRAMEAGRMDETVERHMTTRVVVLEEDMPLTFGATYFDKYGFGRFPVLNRENLLVGILTSRDVSSALLMALYREFDKLESRRAAGEKTEDDPALLRFRVQRFDFENAGRASHEIKKRLTARQVHPRTIRRAAVAAYEMEINQAVHSYGGTLFCRIGADCVEITAEDNGPGISDVDEAMREGFTTATEWIKSLGFGAGMGLANIRRVSDDFEIRSHAGSGTLVRSVIVFREEEAPLAPETAS